MNKVWLYIAVLFFSVFAQAQEVECRMENGQVYMTIPRLPQSAFDSICQSLNTGVGFVDSLQSNQVRIGSKTKKWRVKTVDKKYVVLETSLAKLTQVENGRLSPFDLFIVEEYLPPPAPPVPTYEDHQFGYNRYTKYKNREDGATALFYLPGNQKAKEVYLGGTFNNWSYEKTPMVQTDSGWVVSLGLKPGLHLYKFVVDGHWELDPLNKEVLGDFMGNENNGLYITNTTFSLSGYKDARKVVVAGSFNAWDERDFRLVENTAGWDRRAFLPEGTHTYKYIVDGDWMLDPANKMFRYDDQGNANSVMAIGDTFVFKLNGFANVGEVFVAGSFNNWNEKELKMQKKNGVWELPYVLKSGNYQYKFVVDGDWILDPGNPKTAFDMGKKNSLLCINPNHTFTYPFGNGVEKVHLSGTFTGWENGSYTMMKTIKGWELSIYLPEGKHLYKYIADGKWTLDSSNALYEENQYGTGNSVLWID